MPSYSLYLYNKMIILFYCVLYYNDDLLWQVGLGEDIYDDIGRPKKTVKTTKTPVLDLSAEDNNATPPPAQ